MNYDILSKIKSPADVKKLSNGDIGALCAEIRSCIINTVSENGGHLSSNLGAVELTVALHRVFNTPEDALIFDVGHQSYTHKLLTGRYDTFCTLRKENGISGFMRPDESEHDAFITGHSSNSISAAYGIYKAKRLSGEKGTAVAVIGDGAMTGGMAYEALNNAGADSGNFIVVLNDNKMSISKNVGSVSKSFTKMRNKPKYHKMKFVFSNFLLKIPFAGTYLHKFFFSLKEAFKGIIYKNNIFESMGFNYLGPVDGHNVEAMASLFEIAKNYNRPSLVHVITTKGKGYPFAEKKPTNYHGVASFDIGKGADSKGLQCFSSVAGNAVCKLAKSDRRICAVTAAMTEGTGLFTFSQSFKDRFFDVGIAEEHAVTFCAGLSKGGMKPFLFIYSTFLQRGFDQIIHDTAIGGFPVKFMIDRAGIVGSDGETHQGVFDIPYLTLIPKINIYSPTTFAELESVVHTVSKNDEICAVRYPRGGEAPCAEYDMSSEFSVIKPGCDKAVITYGRLYSEACTALKALNGVSLIKLNKVFPISRKLTDSLMNFKEIHIFEETVQSGCIGEHLLGKLNECGFKGKFVIHALPNEFVPVMSVSSALKKYGLDADSMLHTFGVDNER